MRAVISIPIGSEGSTETPYLATEDITGLNTIALDASPAGPAGIILTLTSTNSGETLSSYAITSYLYAITIKPQSGLAVTFQNISFSGDIIIDGNVGDYLVIEYRAGAWREKSRSIA